MDTFRHSNPAGARVISFHFPILALSSNLIFFLAWSLWLVVAVCYLKKFFWSIDWLRSGFGENLFSDHRTIHLMKRMASTMLTAAIEAVQFSASFVVSLFASFWWNFGTAMNFVFFYVLVTLKIANTPPYRSAALVSSIINWMYRICTGIPQLRQIWTWTRSDIRKMARSPICRSQIRYNASEMWSGVVCFTVCCSMHWYHTTVLWLYR